ncbi:MAG: hypothetical protein LBC41_04345 [Clostridiales bacterium]|jgi:hypothetical protein|nr:hypothetical protein [Clostridiales bacterium]MDR2749872.1 hypothetical protein [Clostridiales bacterium]
MKRNPKKTTRQRIKKNLQQILIVFPSIFSMLLLAFGLMHGKDGLSSEYSLVMDEPVPYGASRSLDPIESRRERINSIDYVFVYEKDTQQYLVYDGFDCLGRILLDYTASINDYEGTELLGMMEPLDEHQER